MYLFCCFRVKIINFILINLIKASEKNLRDEIDALEEKSTVLEKSLTVNVIFFNCSKFSSVKYSCRIIF